MDNPSTYIPLIFPSSKGFVRPDINQRMEVYYSIKEESRKKYKFEYKLLNQELKEEINSNIPIRARVLKELFDNNSQLSYLPELPFQLWCIISEYEGGVESSLLGEDSSNDCFECCIIL